MQQTTLLHKFLGDAHVIKNKKRLDSLMHAVESVTLGGKLSLTSMGRYMNKTIKPRSKIQAVNYLLGNGQLYSERVGIYKAMNLMMCSNLKEINVIIDWSSLVSHETHLLRASLVTKTRSLVLYEELYPESKLGNKEVHQQFLQNLLMIFPSDRKVTIITDAGFKTDFFQQVEALGWNYVGRLLTNMHYTMQGKDEWQACSELYTQANSKPTHIGSVDLSKCNRLKSHLYLYKKTKPLDTSKKKRKIKYGRKEKDCSNAANKPWLIASSVKTNAKKIMKLYKQRMKIEHEFRDMKDKQWGIGLRASRCKDIMRLQIQLLIGALAAFCLWIIGLCLEKQKLHYDFQANSIRHKRVLSLIFLALEAIRSNYLRLLETIDSNDLLEIINYENALQDG